MIIFFEIIGVESQQNADIIVFLKNNERIFLNRFP